MIGFEGSKACRANNTYIQQLTRSYDWIVPLAFVPLDSRPPSATAINSVLARYAGLALYVLDPGHVAALNQWPQDILRTISDSARIVSINVPARMLSLLGRFVNAVRPCPVLLSHLGLPGPQETWPSRNPTSAVESVLAFRSLHWVGVKVSGLYAVSTPPHAYPHREAWPILDILYDSFGASRLYWGSDYGSALTEVSFPQTIDILGHVNWPHHEREQVMGGNLLELIGNSPWPA